MNRPEPRIAPAGERPTQARQGQAPKADARQRQLGAGRRPAPGRRGRNRRGRPYTLTVEQVEALGQLARHIALTAAELGLAVDVPAVARAAGTDPGRLRLLLEADQISDPTAVAAAPGRLRRPRRSTLERLAAAAGMPAAVVDVWCRHNPTAVAAERPGGSR